MNLPFLSKQRDLRERDEHDDDNNDRDLVVLFNEARTPADATNAVRMARMRRSA